MLRDVAEQTGLDFTLLSRFETGERIPTEEQADTLAKFFKANRTEAHALRIAGQFRKKFADHPAARAAILRLAEMRACIQHQETGNREWTLISGTHLLSLLYSCLFASIRG